MKYRWTTSIMTRHSGVLTIFCKSLDQATENVNHYEAVLIGPLRLEYPSQYIPPTAITFDSITCHPNVMLMADIIAVSVGDMELQHDIAYQEMIEHKRLCIDVDITPGEGGYG